MKVTTFLCPVLALALCPMATAQTSSPTPQAADTSMKPTLADFTDLPKDLTFDELVRHAGWPDKDVGSGVFIWVWHLADGSTVSASSGDSHGKRIDDITHIVGKQRTKLYPVPK